MCIVFGNNNFLARVICLISCSHQPVFTILLLFIDDFATDIRPNEKRLRQKNICIFHNKKERIEILFILLFICLSFFFSFTLFLSHRLFRHISPF